MEKEKKQKIVEALTIALFLGLYLLSGLLFATCCDKLGIEFPEIIGHY